MSSSILLFSLFSLNQYFSTWSHKVSCGVPRQSKGRTDVNGPGETRLEMDQDKKKG